MIDDKLRKSILSFIEKNFVIDHYFYSGLSRLHNSGLYIGSIGGFTNQYKKMDIIIDISHSNDHTYPYILHDVFISHYNFEIFLQRESFLVNMSSIPNINQEVVIYKNFTIDGPRQKIIDILNYSL